MNLATSSSERISGTTEDCSLGQSDFVDGSALNPASSSDVGHASLVDSDTRRPATLEKMKSDASKHACSGI